MDHFQKIYNSQASAYHHMIAVEDCDQNILNTLLEITSFYGKQVIDLGTGTGRLPILIQGYAARVIGVDLYRDMLRQNTEERSRLHGEWDLVQSDIRCLPFRAQSAQVVTAGWAIGHLRAWFAEDWQGQIGRILKEMHHLAAPEGCLIILETMTTGSHEPKPPTPQLAEYYSWLEQEWGFSRRVIQTDYQFDSVEDAVDKTRFFFGDELAGLIREHGWARLPEWTGIWSKTC